MTKSLMAEILENPSAYACRSPFGMEHPLYEHYFECRLAGLAAGECSHKNWEKAYNEAFLEAHKK